MRRKFIVAATIGAAALAALLLTVEVTVGVREAAAQAITHFEGQSMFLGRVAVGQGGTIGTATADGDLYVKDGVEVDGSAVLGDAAADTLTVNAATTLSATGGVTFANSESLNTDTDATFDFTRNDAGAVTITASDNNTVADLTVLAGGAAVLTLGGATGTSWIGLTDNDFSLRNGATGSVTLDFRDYADSADDDMAHVEMLVNCTDATTGAEDCDLTIGVVEAGAAADTRFAIDADAGVTIGSATNASVNFLDLKDPSGS